MVINGYQWDGCPLGLELAVEDKPTEFSCTYNNIIMLYLNIPSTVCVQAQREDELEVAPEEVLEVLEWDDGDGWCKGRNKAGKEGYFPQSYVQPSSRSSSPPTATPNAPPTTTQHQESVSTLSSMDATVSMTSSSIMNGSVGKL